MSIRWTAQTTLKSYLATEVTPGNGYVFDLSPFGVVDQGILSFADLMSTMQGDVAVQIEEGDEGHVVVEISPDTRRDALFEIALACLVRGESTDDPVRKRANDFLGDINIAIGKNPTLTGAVRRCHVARVDAPAYHPDSQIAEILVRLVVDYGYMAGINV